MNSPSPSSGAPTGVRATFRALRYRNYRLFFSGQSISLIGTWLQGVALSWLVYSMTRSPFLLGLVGFTSQIATFLISPFAGVVVDRINRHSILVATQSLAMTQAFVLAFLVLGHVITVWQILLLSFFLGLVNGFDTPTRQAFVVDIVEDRRDLSNAIALNSSMFNSARLVGPSIAGVLIAAVGVGYCFLINAISYVAVIIALLAMRVAWTGTPRTRPNVVGELTAGFTSTFGFRPMRALIALLALASLVGMPYAVLMPVFATKILGGDARTLGFLTAASGVGALVGAMYLASRRSVLGLGKWVPIAAVVFGLGLVAFSQSTLLWLSLLILAIVGAAFVVQMAASNTILQTIVEDEMRGRMMSFYTMAFMGTAPFGSLLAGVIAARIGAPYTVMIGGGLIFLGGVWFAFRLPALRAQVRPIYERRGIIPEVARGVQSVSETMIPPEER